MIQLREKELPSLEFYNQAVAVKQGKNAYDLYRGGAFFHAGEKNLCAGT